MSRTRRILSSTGGLLALLLFTAVGVYGWAVLNRSCETGAVKEASALLVSQMRQYDDVYISTAAAPDRNAITYPITVMQKILVDTQQVDVPRCMRSARNELVEYMRDAIHAFRAFEAQEDDAIIKGWLDSSHSHIRAFRMELDAVQACAPNCFRLRDLLPSP